MQLYRDETLIPKYTLDGIDMQDLKREAVTDSKFIKILTRRLYSIYERAPNCNVMGRSHRGSISPQRRRFDLICRVAGPYLDGRLDVLEKEAKIRNGIDTTNRNYRDELRQRKRRLVLEQEAADEVIAAAQEEPQMPVAPPQMPVAPQMPAAAQQVHQGPPQLIVAPPQMPVAPRQMPAAAQQVPQAPPQMQVAPPQMPASPSDTSSTDCRTSDA